MRKISDECYYVIRFDVRNLSKAYQIDKSRRNNLKVVENP